MLCFRNYYREHHYIVYCTSDFIIKEFNRYIEYRSYISNGSIFDTFDLRNVWSRFNFRRYGLKEKSIGEFVSIISAIFLFLSNTFVLNLPNIIYIIPFTSGIDFMRTFYIHSQFDIKLLIIYFVVSIIWFISGIIIFNKLLKKSEC